MTHKSLRDKIASAWKGLVAFFVVLSGLASMKALGWLEFSLNDLVSLLFTPIPLLYLVMVVIVAGVFLLVLRISPKSKRTRKGVGSVLELTDARRLVALCIEPQTTAYLKAHYIQRQRESPVTVLGGMGFDDYLKRLEDEGHLIYTRTDGKWRATEEAFAIIEKYGGEVLRS